MQINLIGHDEAFFHAATGVSELSAGGNCFGRKEKVESLAASTGLSDFDGNLPVL